MAPHLPDLVKLYLRNIAIGFALSAVFVGVLLWKDVMGLWSLASGTQGGWIAIAMLFVFNGLVFAGVQFAIAIMNMADDDDDDDDKGHRDPVGLHDPVPVRVKH